MLGLPLGAVLICRQQVMLCSFAIAVNLGQSSNGNGREEKSFKLQPVEKWDLKNPIYTVVGGKSV